ncbi:cytochrome P450 [Aspergillus bertholletiae]|uniref:Cytochrome P450 n=1 Tax=Aspergillus bertholletiae TaxID=1226010 RepID=A0A5N7BDQ5_9EURO|nr:cytochrome P450 [Aspergillus bertholletiae]
MMPTLFQAICATCIALATYTASLAIYRLFLSPLAKFPGPTLAALTGWYEVFFGIVLGGQFMWEIERLHRKYGPIVCISPHELHIKDPDYYNTLYAGPTKRRDKYLWFLSVGIPTSTFATAEYDHHRDLEAVIKGKLDLLCEHMKKAMRSGEAVELHAAFMSFAVDVISTCAFGESGCFEVPRRERLDDRWKMAVNGVFAKFIPIRHFPWLIVIFHFLPVRFSALVTPVVRYFAFIEKEIEHQMQGVYAKNEGGMKEGAIFSELMHNRKIPLKERTLDRLTDDAKFLMIAGTDAPSRVLVITMFHVIGSPLVCRGLREELQHHATHPQDKLCLSQLEKLPYLTADIKEGLRVSAIVTSRLPRIAPDEMLEFRGWKIPSGPERRLKLSIMDSNLEKYLGPFSKGSQGCLGPNMTYAWLYLVLATLLPRFEFSLFETTEENIKTVTDCINGQAKSGQNHIRVKVLAESM